MFAVAALPVLPQLDAVLLEHMIALQKLQVLLELLLSRETLLWSRVSSLYSLPSAYVPKVHDLRRIWTQNPSNTVLILLRHNFISIRPLPVDGLSRRSSTEHIPR